MAEDVVSVDRASDGAQMMEGLTSIATRSDGRSEVRPSLTDSSASREATRASKCRALVTTRE